MSVSCVRIPAARGATAAVIFLHGLGDSGSGWAFLPQYLAQSGAVPGLSDINFVFPNAPAIPVTINGGMKMPAWFDIYELGNPNARQDVSGFLHSTHVVQQLVHEQMEKHQIKPERIIIGGFSQGAALTMAALATLDVKIGGLVALLGFLPIKDDLAPKVVSANFDTPVFQGHGDADPVVAFDYGKRSADFYQKAGFKSWKFHAYANVPHSASEEELADVAKFIASVLA